MHDPAWPAAQGKHGAVAKGHFARPPLEPLLEPGDVLAHESLGLGERRAGRQRQDGQAGGRVDAQDQPARAGIPPDGNGNLSAADLDVEFFRAALQGKSHGRIIANCVCDANASIPVRQAK